MAVARSWYLSMHGAFTSGTWVGEIAQVGIRGTAVDSGGFFTPVVNSPLGEFEAVSDGAVEQTADYNITYGFRGTSILTQTHQKAMAAAALTYVGAIKSLQINSGFVWNEFRLAALDANNDYINGATVFSLRTPVAGTGGQTQLPQSCVVASLRSGGRTARTRGRMYVPASGIALATGGLVGSTQIAAVGNATAALVNALEAVNANIYPGVVSLKYGTFSTITTVKVGDEVDTQRRRRYKRPETYTDYAV